ncbi:MAG: Hpt domain-containing protein [Rhizobiaceae bacterium]|jgi:HPt (histidine-containing phosphotransfer) domain-containing protein
MKADDTEAVGFSMPGGEQCGAARARPIDLAHLERQTLGDRTVEAEVLSLFLHQATTVYERICSAEPDERRELAHGLKGSALGIGAFAVAEAASSVEADAESRPLLKALSRRIEEVRDFIAAISR